MSTGKVDQVATGLFQHSCAVMVPDQKLGESGNLICWGEDNALQTDVPRPVSAMESSFKEEHLNSQTISSNAICVLIPMHRSDDHEYHHALILYA